MSAISLVTHEHRSSLRQAPLLQGIRRGTRSFTREVVGSVPLLQRSRPKLHLTRRGRLLLVGLPTLLGGLAAAALLILLLVPSQVTAGTEAVEGPGVEAVTVQPGQSLWEVARVAEPEKDTRAVVAQIVELNGFDTAQVRTGQQVLVPAA